MLHIVTKTFRKTRKMYLLHVKYVLRINLWTFIIDISNSDVDCSDAP